MSTAMMTPQGRRAAAERSKAESVAEADRRIERRLIELGADGPMDRTALKRLAESDAELRRLVLDRFLAEQVPDAMLEAGYVPIVGEPGEPIRWKHESRVRQH